VGSCSDSDRGWYNVGRSRLVFRRSSGLRCAQRTECARSAGGRACADRPIDVLRSFAVGVREARLRDLPRSEVRLRTAAGQNAGPWRSGHAAPGHSCGALAPLLAWRSPVQGAIPLWGRRHRARGRIHMGWRAASLHEQAAIPLLAANEMANASPAEVATRLSKTQYAAKFRTAFGSGFSGIRSARSRRACRRSKHFSKSLRNFIPIAADTMSSCGAISS